MTTGHGSGHNRRETSMTLNARKGLAVLSALVVALAAALWLVGAQSAQATANAVHKSYVCKYVDKPGEAERLQTGQNPIWVDNHALLGHDGTTVVGQEFSDAQGRSVVIVANTPKLDPEPSIEDCPPPNPPPTPTPTPTPTETVPVTPTPVQFSFDDVVTPPTCEAAGALLVDRFPGVTVTVSPAFDGPGHYTLTATLDDPEHTTFSDGTTEPKTREVDVLAATGFQSTDPEAACFLATPTPTPTTTTPTPTPTVTTPTPTPTQHSVTPTPTPTPTHHSATPSHHSTTPAQPTHLAKTGTPTTTYVWAGLLALVGGLGLVLAGRTPKTARRH